MAGGRSKRFPQSDEAIGASYPKRRVRNNKLGPVDQLQCNLLLQRGATICRIHPRITRSYPCWKVLHSALREAATGITFMSSKKANVIIIALTVAVLVGGAYLLVVSQGNQADGSVAEAALGLRDATQVAPEEATLPKVVHDLESGTTYVSYAMPMGAEGANLFLKHSIDGGKTWSKPVQVSRSGQVLDFEASPQQMAIGPNGEVYLVWTNNYTENNPYQYGKGVVVFARSTDRGRSFEPPVSVGPDVDDTAASRNFQNVAVAPDGTVYVSVLQSDNAKMDDQGRSVRVVASEDGGRTWSTGSLVSNGTCQCCRTTLAASSNGKVYVGWRQIDGTGDAIIRDAVVAHSSDGGKTWSQPVEYYDDQWKLNGCPHAGPSLELDGRGRLHATWFTGAERRLGIYHAISTDNGQSWSEPTPVFTPDYTPVTEPEMLVDSKDNAWIAFNDLRSPNGEKAKAHGSGHHAGHGAHGGPAKIKVVEIAADGEKVAFLDIDGRDASFAELASSIALVWKAQAGGIYFSTFQE